MTTHTDGEEFDIMMHALLEIARGAWFLYGVRQKAMSRDDCIERARRAATELGLDWSQQKPERHIHAARLSLLPKKRTPVPTIPPNPVGRPHKKHGMAAFILAGQGAK